MANTKGKIIIGAGVVLVGGITAYIIATSIRKKKVMNRIYEKLEDASFQSLANNVGADDVHKYSLAIDPKFWQKKSGTPIPTNLIKDRVARGIAKEIYANIGTIWDDESKIMTAIKQTKTKGQMSQVTFQYNALGYGDLGDALKSGLSGGIIVEDKLKELNRYLNALPN